MEPLRFRSEVVITSHRAMHDRFLLWRKCCFFELAEEAPEGSLSRDLMLEVAPEGAPGDEEEALFPRDRPLDDVDEEAMEAALAEEDRARFRLTTGTLAPPPLPPPLLPPPPEVEGPVGGNVKRGGPGKVGPETDSFE